MVRITGHTDTCYNGDYVRGTDWYDLPHYVQAAEGDCEEHHLYYRYTTYLQLDNRDQEITGWADYYAGGYTASGPFDGSPDEVNQCYDYGYILSGSCFEFFPGTATEAEEAVADESASDEWVTVSGHYTACYDGDYYRGADWYDLPHYVKAAEGDCDELHLYHRYTSYLQLDDRDQELTGWADNYRGGYTGAGWPFDGSSDELN